MRLLLALVALLLTTAPVAGQGLPDVSAYEDLPEWADMVRDLEETSITLRQLEELRKMRSPIPLPAPCFLADDSATTATCVEASPALRIRLASVPVLIHTDRDLFPKARLDNTERQRALALSTIVAELLEEPSFAPKGRTERDAFAALLHIQRWYHHQQREGVLQGMMYPWLYSGPDGAREVNGNELAGSVEEGRVSLPRELGEVVVWRRGTTLDGMYLQRLDAHGKPAWLMRLEIGHMREPVDFHEVTLRDLGASGFKLRVDGTDLDKQRDLALHIHLNSAGEFRYVMNSQFYFGAP